MVSKNEMDTLMEEVDRLNHIVAKQYAIINSQKQTLELEALELVKKDVEIEGLRTTLGYND